MPVRRLTRDQIAKIVNNDPEAIRAFEDLFRQATADAPTDILILQEDTEALQQEPSYAYALEALSWLQRIQDRLDRYVYAEIIKTSDQVAGAPNTAEGILWDSISVQDGVTLGSPASRIVIPRAGIYKFDLSVQLESASSSQKSIWLWFAVNGTDVDDSASIETETLNGGYSGFSRAEYLELSANDYVEVMMAVDDVALFLSAAGATAFAPAASAAILTISQVAP